MATSRKLHVVGPLLPSTKKAAAIEMEQAAKSPEITAFMDEAQLAHGERSLIYVSLCCSQTEFLLTHVIDILWDCVLDYPAGKGVDVP